MKVGKKQTYIILLELCVLLYSFIYLNLYSPSLVFVKYSRFGVIVLLLDFVLFCIAQKRIVTIQTLFLMLFVLFQFGLPIVYAFNPKHYNFYMTLFSEETLIGAVKYTIFAIQIYIIIATCVISNQNHAEKKGNVGKWTKTILTHPRDVEDAALLLFIITAVVAVPVNLWSAVRALTADGAIGNLYRGAMAANGLTRFLQEFFFSSALLYLCFSNKKMRKKVVTAAYLVVALSMILVADRSGGVTALIVCALYYYYTGDKRKRKKNTVVLIGIGIILAIVSSAVANIRSGESRQSVISLLLSALEEMGFNFTSLCFVMDYIPSRTSYRLGMSYVAALILLIPKSLGLRSVYPKLQSYLGETWLWNANNLYGRDFLSFGVGFSLIAESYYNFSWCGLVVMIPLAVIITHFLKEKKVENAWSLYIRLALMLSFFTAPRRQFHSVIKAIEYSVFFMALYILVYIRTRRKDKRNETANGINRRI
mgnify:FL=1